MADFLHFTVFFLQSLPILLHLINGFKKKLLHFIRKFRLTLYQHVAMKFRHEVPFTVH